MRTLGPLKGWGRVVGDDHGRGARADASAPRWFGALAALALVIAPGCWAAVSLAFPTAVSAASRSRAVAAIPYASGRLTKVIVLLRDSPSGLAPRSAARAAVLRGEQRPLWSLLESRGASVQASGSALPFLVASVTAAQRRALASEPQVRLVVPDSAIPLSAPGSNPNSSLLPVPGSRPTNYSGRSSAVRSASAAANLCGSAAAPESDPEAINVIKAPLAAALGYDGAGITVAYIAGPINPANPDLQRNARYASSPSPAGSPILTQENFAGDPANAQSREGSLEAFLDASAIAAQGNTTYNLDDFVNSSHPLPSPCDIKITGSAPGARLLGLDAYPGYGSSYVSGLIQAIDYAVAHGSKVLNESLGFNYFPDTALDATRIADDDAVAAGVTVVTSSGDAGVTSTIGSPATDPHLISVGASTTFRAYAQATFGGINASAPVAGSGGWLDNNISSLSSGGFSQQGATVDLVAPGDSNWALCDTNISVYAGCTNFQSSSPSSIQFGSGTSQAAPLTAGAAADVIQAYAKTHRGQDPSPALVKQILMSTATDIGAPAIQQGAGLLNVVAAVREAASISGTNVKRQGGLLVSPNQVNIVQSPGARASRVVSVTNTASVPVTVNLRTRALTHEVASQGGSFCLNPSSSVNACGPPTSNTFPIWNGITEVYQEETFSVPSATSASRLNFSADYPYSGQSSSLHVALLDPTGAYAGYSLPQGLGDFANVQVADPRPGTWTAVFFTLQDSGASHGTSGAIHWRATTSEFAPAGRISPSSLRLAPGATAAATFQTTSPATAGDGNESIVLSSSAGGTTTIPVTMRTMVPLGANGGVFTGILTGGDGRPGYPSQTNTYAFNVPAGKRDLDVSARFADKTDAVIAYLVNPQGETVASSSSVTHDSSMTNIIQTGTLNVYKDAPVAGTWDLVLWWLQPVSGSELSEPFTGAVQFNQVNVSSNLPSSKSTTLKRGRSYSFHVRVKNTAASPEAFFLDPRTATGSATIRLTDRTGSDQNMSLPLPGGTIPLYTVPTDTSQLRTRLTGSGPVTYDVSPLFGDPDLSPAITVPGVASSQSGDAATLNFTPSGEVAPGLWDLMPSEIGPYGPSGENSITASATVSAVTQAFTGSVRPSTGDLWSAVNGITQGFHPVYLAPGQSATIALTITPIAAPGRQVRGVVNLDDVFQVDPALEIPNPGGDELATLPLTYTVGS